MGRLAKEKPGARVPGPLLLSILAALLVAIVLGAVVLPALAARGKAPELPVYGAVPSFAMVDHTGQEVTREDLRGYVTIVNFIFTRCPTVCPTFTATLRAVQEKTLGFGGRLKLVSITVDPDYDTPEVLAAYAAKFGADPSRWRFLRGEPAALVEVATDGFMVAVEKRGAQANGAPNIVHAEHFILVDPSLQLRGFYNSNDPQRIERMIQDAKRLSSAP